MAIAIITQKSLQKPPAKCVELDLTHPLADGLVFAALLNEYGGISAREYVTNSRVGTWATTNFNWGASVSGYGPAFSGSNNDSVRYPGATSVYAKQPLPMSMVACVRATSLASANRGIMANDDGLSYTGVSMFAFTSGTIQVNFGDGGGATTNDRRSGRGANFPIAIDETYHLVGVVRAASDMDIYNNGRRDSLIYDGGGGAMTYAGNPTCVGRWTAATGAWIGWIYHAYFYNRILTPSDAMWLYTEQYAMFKPIKVRTFTIGGITPVSTARSWGSVFG